MSAIYKVISVSKQVRSNHLAWADFQTIVYCRIECELLRLHYMSACPDTHEVLVIESEGTPDTPDMTPTTAALLRAQALYAGVEEGHIRAPRELHERPAAFVWPLLPGERGQSPAYYAQMLNDAPAELVGIRSRWDWQPGDFAAHGRQIKVQGRRHYWRTVDDRIEIHYS